MRKIRRVICLLLTAVILCTFTSSSVYAGTNLSGITSDNIKKMQNQIKEAENQQKQIKSSISSAKNLKAELEGLKKDTKAYITKVDAQIAEIEAKIEEYEGLITEKEAEIVAITAELEQAIATEKAQYEAMKKRIKFMYEQGDYFYVEIMFSATTFGDFLTRADYVEKLSAYDRQKLNEYVEIREYTEMVKATLEAEKVLLDEAKAAKESEQQALEEIRKDKEKELVAYEQKIEYTSRQITDYEADLAEEKRVIEALEASVLAEQKAIAARQGVVMTYDGGKFTWPAPSYIRVTDEFGWRTDPINGSRSYHSGIDLGSAAGSSILAAYDGVVVSAAYDWSMGNYVMINHGDGLFTIYMHCSKLLVKVDDVVARGEKIALVGSTGRSTGPHLHFGVRLNGTYVSPWPYFGVNK